MSAVFITALQTILGLLGQSNITTTTITNVINFLVQIIPLIEKEYEAMVPYIQEIIDALRGSPETTAAQMLKLEELDAAADKAFEDAASKAQAEDA